jgi:hypothetical protein
VSEAELHRAVADFLGRVLDHSQVEFTTFPAGGGGRIRGAQLKAMGLKAGLGDILILPRGRCACWLELKAAKGTVKPEQKAMHQRLRDLGCMVAVCRSVDEVEGTLRAWQIPLKGRLAA